MAHIKECENKKKMAKKDETNASNEVVICEVKEKGERALSINNYGFWWGKNVTPEQLVEKCDAKITECEHWLSNLKEMKAKQEDAIKAKRESELKELIKTISKENLKELFKDMTDEEFLALKS